MSGQAFLHCIRKFGTVGVAMTTALLATACHKHQLPEASLLSVRAAPAEAIAVDSESRYSAVITPFAQVDLGFKSPGIVAGIRQVRGADGRVRNVGVGDQITKGADLAWVRAADYQPGVDQSEAQVDQAKAQIADATATYRTSQLNWDRSQSLFQSGSLIKPQYDQAKASFESAQAQISAANAMLASANSGLARTRLGLADTVVRAPFTGWVTARSVEIGSLASSGALAFSMVDSHLVKAAFAVPDVALGSVHLGNEYDVELDALPRPVRGIVTAISQQADAKTHVFTVELTLPNLGDNIRPGMISAIRLRSSGPQTLRVVIPLDAVVRPPSRLDGFAVYVLEERDGRVYARAKTITVGNTYGNSIEVLSGLARGERIVSVGASLLKGGQEVRVIR